MECPYCHNTDENYFSTKNGIIYCRKCVPLRRPEAPIPKYIDQRNHEIHYVFTLTAQQSMLSQQLLHAPIESYVDAVCGSGKTEIVYASMKECLDQGKRVGFALPRRELVIDLHRRLSTAFPSSRVESIYGGHCKNLDGDIIVLTTHQIGRYKNKFGLLIIDEFDAFPFQGSDVLHQFAKNSCYGRFIYLSASFSKDFLENKRVYSLPKRFHNHPLIEPKVEKHSYVVTMVRILHLIHDYQRQKKPVLLYVATIQEGKNLFFFLRNLFPHTVLFHSLITEKEQQFRLIQAHLFFLIIATTILERSITIPNVQVIVLDADHRVFRQDSLLQIAGRSGRTSAYPNGEVTFFCRRDDSKAQAVKQRIRTINDAVYRLS